MPVSRRSIAPQARVLRGLMPPLRVPQARVLRGLMPPCITDPPYEWPCLTRIALADRAGYTAISGSVTRALNGIHPGSSSGDPHIGLIGMKYVDVINIDVDGVEEQNYRITQLGIQAYVAFLAMGGQLPPVKDASICVNQRYRKEDEQ